jgi:hypothetical protein
MDSNESPKIFDIASLAPALAAMEAWYAALAEALPKMRTLVSLSGALVPEGAIPGFSNQSPTLIAPGEVPPGSFHGQSIPQAAVTYLRMVKQKQKASEIATALRRGGIQTTSSDFNNQVHAALDRASKKKNAEILKMHDAYWGLREWLSASVRASMATGSGAKGKKNTRAKKRKALTPVTIDAKIEMPKPKSKSNGAAHDQSTSYKAPKPGSTEGRILDAMYAQPTKEWTPSEVASAAAIPRVQTVHFLLGKMAYRDLVSKTENGTYTLAILQ